MQGGIRLLLVGCGKMGGAILSRVVSLSLISSAVVIDPSGAPDGLKSLSGVTWHRAVEGLDASFEPDIVLFAVKPQHMADVAPRYARFGGSAFLSIAAGTTISRLQELLGDRAHSIVRTMPNLPASLGAGVSVAVANRYAAEAQRAQCEALLASVGKVAWVDNEGLLDAVTALSGSGPAYVFALCEAMAKAGQALGLSADLAALLARQTIVGSGAMLDRLPESAETMRRAVTSPGGTTEAALKVLSGERGLDGLLLEAMSAAARRAGELAH